MYKKKIVVYLDILGYKNILEEKCKDKPDELIEIMKKISNELGFQYSLIGENISLGTHEKLWITSDSIIIIYNWIDYINNILIKIINLQFELIETKNIIIRGSISFGNHYDDFESFYKPYQRNNSINIFKNIIISPAYVKAYKLESEIAIYPRIIIDNELLDNVTKNDELENIIKYSNDKRYFLNYLGYKVKESNDSNNILQDHKTFIENNLKKYYLNNQRIYEKYCWLADYHNEICNTNEAYKITQ